MEETGEMQEKRMVGWRGVAGLKRRTSDWCGMVCNWG